MVLDKEIAYFEREREHLVEHHEGKYALVFNEELVGVWDTSESAYVYGIRRLGDVSFLIKHVLKEDRVEEVPLLFVGV